MLTTHLWFDVWVSGGRSWMDAICLIWALNRFEVTLRFFGIYECWTFSSMSTHNTNHHQSSPFAKIYRCCDRHRISPILHSSSVNKPLRNHLSCWTWELADVTTRYGPLQNQQKRKDKLQSACERCINVHLPLSLLTRFEMVSLRPQENCVLFLDSLNMTRCYDIGVRVRCEFTWMCWALVISAHFSEHSLACNQFRCDSCPHLTGIHGVLWL